MPLPTSGAISLLDVRNELGYIGGAQGLKEGSDELGVTGAPYGMNELYGASSFNFAISPTSIYAVGGGEVVLISITNDGYSWSTSRVDLGDGTSWFRALPTSGSATSCDVLIEPNPTPVFRSGKIVFTCNGETKDLVIDQEIGEECFDPYTPITMPDLSKKYLKDITLGEEILSMQIPNLKDDESNATTWNAPSMEGSVFTKSKVTRLIHGSYRSHYVINNRLKVTYEHRLLVRRNMVWRFIPVIDIKPGDSLYNEYHSEEVIFSVDRINKVNPFITMDVEETDVYFAGGILAHNPFEIKDGDGGGL